MVLLYLGIFVCIEFTPPYLSLLCLLHPRLDVVTASLFYLPTCVYLCVPCLQVLTLGYLIYMHSIYIYLCLLRLPHCMRLHVQLCYLCLHTWAIQVYIYVVPVSENFILTMMIKLEVMMRRMTVTMTRMVTDCISTMMMKITREMKTKMMYQ